jgi:hypothetical protein
MAVTVLEDKPSLLLKLTKLRSLCCETATWNGKTSKHKKKMYFTPACKLMDHRQTMQLHQYTRYYYLKKEGMEKQMIK